MGGGRKTFQETPRTAVRPNVNERLQPQQRKYKVQQTSARIDPFIDHTKNVLVVCVVLKIRSGHVPRAFVAPHCNTERNTE